MSAADQGPAGGSLTREQVLDELEFLAKVEHALVIECLSVCYALGYDLGPDEGGPTTGQGSEAAGAASSLAQNSEMFHLDDLNTALVHANQHAQLDRAASIPGGPGPDIPLGPPNLAQLHAAAFAAITDPLAGLAPGDYLRATRRLAADSFEERLLAASDRGYRLKSWLRGVSDRRPAPSV